ncbi:MAG: PAS domain S-box protein [Verrucomicrobia bacterium]|nr:PAS domain S-box protein [Verrucomicrobiota bacterium]MBU1908809.1 PAS domain S-box protein [Verrucomicrobiota bacterium]
MPYKKSSTPRVPGGPEARGEGGKKYQALFEAATDAIFLETLEGQILDCNPAAVRMFGYTLEEMLRLKVTDLMPEEVARTLPALITEELTTGGFFVETVNRRRNGELFPVEVSTRMVRIGDEPQVVVFVRDITERKRAEAALAAEKERLLVTLRSIGDGVIATDESGRILLVNKVAERMTGWPQEEAAGRSLAEVFHIVYEKTRARCENPAERVLRGGRISVLAEHTILVARDGTEHVIADSAAPICDLESHIIGVVVAFREITEQRRMEEERLRAQKLESLGLLAGGIAHDFNNILTGILGNISLARVALQSGGDHPALLQEAEKACLRAKDLSQQLLTFARGGAPMRQMTSIAGLVRDTVEFCLRGSNVRADLLSAEDLWAAEVDPGQIAQVVNNVIINSKQAMPGGGVVVVRAENADLEKGGAHPVEPGRYIRITVKDTGAGVPKEYIPKVFDPFFTTKPQSSGLGLTTSYAIVRKHGGHLLLESELGVGTVVHILLPASKIPLPSPPEEERPAPRGTGRVLVMDDEEAVRKVAVRVLEYLGYEPAAVSNGTQAVSEYRQAMEAGRPFAAVVLDLTVPGDMGGRDTLECLRKLDPKVRAIVASGYSSDASMADYRRYGFAGAVVKPFTVNEVGRVMHSVLRG